MIRIAALASGRGSNFQAIADAINTGYIKNGKLAVLISDKADAPALAKAKFYGIESVFVDPKSYEDRRMFNQALLHELQLRKIELVLLCGYMRIVGDAIVDAYSGRIMNIHPSLLPAFAGSTHAQEDALNYGVKISGATVHFVDKGVDTGPIVTQAAVQVLENDTAETLANRILEQEHRIYPYAVKLFCESKMAIDGRKVRILGQT